ncbi:hypothetical protein ACHAPT_009728 [Fusarium lateritium]
MGRSPVADASGSKWNVGVIQDRELPLPSDREPAFRAFLTVQQDDDTRRLDANGMARVENGHSTPNPTAQPEPPSLQESPAAPLTNPLAIDCSSYSLDTSGRPSRSPTHATEERIDVSLAVHLGTSSTWSFSRRVLRMTYETVMHATLPSNNLLFDGTCYDLGWDEQRHISSRADPESITLPSADHARYLISAVQFHCGQLFHLVEEDKFMQCFALYHKNALNSPGLWYIHYLLILALGKAFVARTTKGRKPPGADLFVHAMNILPPAYFFVSDALRMVQILCCAALYLQCLDFRGPAYRIIGQALRLALQEGLHIEMHSQGVGDVHAQRCRCVWWTVYILDRQMSSLMGVPMAISDDAITAGLPTFPEEPLKSVTLEIQIKLSRVLARIGDTVYGAQGRVDKQFLSTTKSVLKSIADVANHLHGSFALPSNATQGISRVSASLHLMQHQCIVLATRPFLYSFLQSRIGRSNPGLIHAARSGSVRNLLLMCLDAAQQILTILSSLQSQDILEGFLRFDLDATFAAHITLLMAPAIDPSLVKGQSTWSQRSYGILDDIICSGNMVAVQMKSELQQLEDILSRLPVGDGFKPGETPQRDNPHSSASPTRASPKPALPQPTAFQGDSQPLEDALPMEGLWWQDGLTAEHLINFANSIDVDSLDIL